MDLLEQIGLYNCSNHLHKSSVYRGGHEEAKIMSSQDKLEFVTTDSSRKGREEGVMGRKQSQWLFGNSELREALSLLWSICLIRLDPLFSFVSFEISWLGCSVASTIPFPAAPGFMFDWIMGRICEHTTQWLPSPPAQCFRSLQDLTKCHLFQEAFLGPLGWFPPSFSELSSLECKDLSTSHQSVNRLPTPWQVHRRV